MSEKLVLFTGASATGKSTIAKRIGASFCLDRMPGDTTRSPRLGEVDGFDYNYISKGEFLNRWDAGCYVDPDIIQAEYNGNYYGSPREWTTSEGGIAVPTSTISTNEVVKIRNEAGRDTLWVHLIADSLARVQRLRERPITDEELDARMNKGDSMRFEVGSDLVVRTDNKGLNKTIDTIGQFIEESRK